LKIAVLRERKEPENRVALTPNVVKSLVKAGFTCNIETGAGNASGFYDSAYESAGASIFTDKNLALSEADILLKVNAPLVDEVLRRFGNHIFFIRLYNS
jgi:NAD(P) transhydrogenase subunit alpha